MTNRMPDYEDMTVREQQEVIREVFKKWDEVDIDNVIHLSTVELANDEN